MNTIEYIKILQKRKFDHEIARRKRRAYLKRVKKLQEIKRRDNNQFGISTFKYQTEKVPDIFCLFSNTEECITFFNKILEYIYEGKKIYIDMSDVKLIDASAIMFYLSMFKNLKFNNIEYDIKGNVPNNAQNYDYLLNTGFLNYVNSNVKTIEINEKTVMIKEGELVLNRVARQVCDFIISHTNKKRVDIKPYYEMLIELMNNTKHHAYIGSDYVHDWYIYCQVIRDKVQILFFDNGLGIPSTVNKSKFEELTRWLNSKGIILGGDVDIVNAALDGAFRTRTQSEHRGKGLPMINNLIKNSIIHNTRIITNHAYLDSTIQKDIKNSLQGTLYSWEVK